FQKQWVFAPGHDLAASISDGGHHVRCHRATGNTGRVIANRLLDAGKKVRLISRSADHLKPFTARGAEPFVADLSDEAALAKAFAGAEAVYAMIPPNGASQDFRAEQQRVTDAIAGALQNAG